MKIRETYTCPLELVHDITKGKWKTIIIFKLRNGIYINAVRTITGTKGIWAG